MAVDSVFEQIEKSCTVSDCNNAKLDDCGIIDDKFCIYHSPKNCEQPELSEKVWAAVRQKLAQKDYNFSNWHFPI